MRWKGWNGRKDADARREDEEEEEEECDLRRTSWGRYWPVGLDREV